MSTWSSSLPPIVYKRKEECLNLYPKQEDPKQKVLAQAGPTAKHYHSDNGYFANNGFIDAVFFVHPKMIFSDVGAHH